MENKKSSKCIKTLLRLLTLSDSYNRLASIGIDAPRIAQLLAEAIDIPGVVYNQLPFSVASVSVSYITHLNTTYRGICRATDVLSFPHEDDEYLGDILVCTVYCKRDHEKVMQCILHGFLHLLGYDHLSIHEEKIMQRIERTAWQSYLKNRASQ